MRILEKAMTFGNYSARFGYTGKGSTRGCACDWAGPYLFLMIRGRGNGILQYSMYAAGTPALAGVVTDITSGHLNRMKSAD
jgi:hypothetical protein